MVFLTALLLKGGDPSAELFWGWAGYLFSVPTDPLTTLLHFALFPRRLTSAEYISQSLAFWLCRDVQFVGNTDDSGKELS